MAAWGRRVAGVAAQRPFLVSALQFGIVASAGDAAAQAVERHLDASGDREWDGRRLGTVAAFGFLVGGPLRRWVGFLDSIRCLGQPGVRSALMKTSAHQLVWNPVYNALFFGAVILGQHCLEQKPDTDKSSRHTLVRVWDDWLDKCLADLLRAQLLGPLFVPVNMWLFMCVPLHLRVPMNATAQSVWNCILSFIANGNSLPAKDTSSSHVHALQVVGMPMLEAC